MVVTEKEIFIEAFKKRTRKFAVDVIYILQFNHLIIYAFNHLIIISTKIYIERSH